MIARLLCVCSLVVVAHSVTMRWDPIHETLPDHSILPYCEYEGIRFLMGSRFRTRDCFECTFDFGSCYCQGFGVEAGVIAPPPGCKVLANGCVPLLVRLDNERVDCSSGFPIG